MTDVKMKAVDTLHVSSVQADNLTPGEEFTVSEDTAKQLEERGLAKRVGAAKVEPKAEPATLNKMAASPANKAKKPAAKKGK